MAVDCSYLSAKIYTKPLTSPARDHFSPFWLGDFFSRCSLRNSIGQTEENGTKLWSITPEAPWNLQSSFKYGYLAELLSRVRTVTRWGPGLTPLTWLTGCASSPSLLRHSPLKLSLMKNRCDCCQSLTFPYSLHLPPCHSLHHAYSAPLLWRTERPWGDPRDSPLPVKCKCSGWKL